jgi:hypothetical protein
MGDEGWEKEKAEGKRQKQEIQTSELFKNSDV